jgi:hypothetical protein
MGKLPIYRSGLIGKEHSVSPFVAFALRAELILWYTTLAAKCGDADKKRINHCDITQSILFYSILFYSIELIILTILLFLVNFSRRFVRNNQSFFQIEKLRD